MDEKLKNVLGGVAVVAAVLLTFAAASYVSSYAKSVDPSSFRSFSAGGEGKAVGVPDVARFTFSVITEGGKNVGALQQENTKKINAINAFIKSQGIAEKDIRTLQYGVDPRYQYFSCMGDGKPCPPPEITGYAVTQSVQVTIRDFSKIGELLSQVVQKGANSVSQLAFAIDDPTTVQNKARAEAIMKARQKAAGLAAAGGFQIGKLLSIEESFSPQPYPMYEKFGMGGGGVAASVPAPAIEPGSQEISVSVTLRYEIR